MAKYTYKYQNGVPYVIIGGQGYSLPEGYNLDAADGDRELLEATLDGVIDQHIENQRQEERANKSIRDNVAIGVDAALQRHKPAAPAKHQLSRADRLALDGTPEDIERMKQAEHWASEANRQESIALEFERRGDRRGAADARDRATMLAKEAADLHNRPLSFEQKDREEVTAFGEKTANALLKAKPAELEANSKYVQDIRKGLEDVNPDGEHTFVMDSKSPYSGDKRTPVKKLVKVAHPGRSSRDLRAMAGGDGSDQDVLDYAAKTGLTVSGREFEDEPPPPPKEPTPEPKNTSAAEVQVVKGMFG